jgi:transglutaminase-like putative cysteine protease
MAILSVKHATTYRYRRPVPFGAHRIMVRPRDDDDQRVLQADLAISPSPRQVAWQRDRFGNHVATALFADQSDELCFISSIRLEHSPNEFRARDIERHARVCPFKYAPEEWARLRRFILPVPLHPKLRRWGDQFFDSDGSADTHDLLVQITRTIRRTFRHEARHEEGILDPVRTLTVRSGSCRDLAVLMVAVLRSRGIAARFVSGYLHLAGEVHDENDWLTGGGNTHAWVQAYIPGPGWVDFDPSAGVSGNRDLIRVAAVPDPRDAIPLQGTWYGDAADYLAMDVAVSVTNSTAKSVGICR